MSDDLIKRSDAIRVTWQEPTYTDPLNVLTEVRDRIEAIPSADRPQGEWIDDIISRLESMAEDMRAMGDVEKAMGVDSALWLIEAMKGADDE